MLVRLSVGGRGGKFVVFVEDIRSITFSGWHLDLMYSSGRLS